MSRFNMLIVVTMTLLLSLWGTLQAQETTVIEKKTIVTPAPKSEKCTTVSGHWEDNVWIDTQTVCTYENRSEGVAWVQDYWACTVFTADGTCSNWEFRPGHWVKTYP